MMSNPREGQLRDEVELGRKAKVANDSFVSPYIASKRKALYNNFCEVSIGDVKVLKEIKRQHTLLDNMEDEINTIINTGKMAAKALEDIEPTEGTI